MGERSTTWWRHGQAFAALPLMVTVLGPCLLIFLEQEWGWRLALSPGTRVILAVVGGPLLAGGVGLMVWSTWLFVLKGRGTLAPWDPTRRLVVVGPYRHVRNPMITGVCLLLLGEAVLFGSWLVLIWFAGFTAGNMLWIPLWEERDLVRRFGDDYRLYMTHVPRWWPRWRPWIAPWEAAEGEEGDD